MTTERQHLLRVTVKDCEEQTFSAGGKGGQNQNRRSTGVRLIHHPSGARGESREHRSQLQNKKAAWKRMVATPEFRSWLRIESMRRAGTLDALIEQQMRPENLLIEYGPDAAEPTSE